MISRNIKNTIAKAKRKRFWTVKDFPDHNPWTVSRTFLRLYKKGFLNKVKNGVYYYGKKTFFGKTAPQSQDIVKRIDAIYFSAGLHAFYNLGLTTQVPASMTIVTNNRKSVVNTRILKRDISHLKNITEGEFWILESLRKINSIPDCTAEVAIIKLKGYIKKHHISLKRLLKASLKEPPRVRALLGAIANELGFKNSVLNKVKNTLNPFTIYNVGAKNSLKYGKKWKIK